MTRHGQRKLLVREVLWTVACDGAYSAVLVNDDHRGIPSALVGSVCRSREQLVTLAALGKSVRERVGQITRRDALKNLPSLDAEAWITTSTTTT